MPKGTGASGKMIVVAEKPNLGLEIINRLEGANLRAYQWMHQPFDKAARLKPTLSRDEKKLVESIKKLWDQINFVDVGADRATTHFDVRIVTNQGIELPMTFAPQYAPNHVRTFIAMAREGLFNGVELCLSKDGMQLALGPEQGTSPFTLRRPVSQRFPTRMGAFIAVPEAEYTDAGTRFAFALGTIEAKPGQFTIFGGVQEEAIEKVFRPLCDAAKAKPGSVKIAKVTATENFMQLFQAGPGPQLPKQPGDHGDEPPKTPDATPVPAGQ
jgi:cyclophilin family peptidyl-prolyl cis-trans isomerase